MQEPKITFVATSRNDGHGGNIMKRMRLFMNGLITQADRHRLPMELIMVEWNPPADKPRLHEVLPKPGPDSMLRVRYITVPERLHLQYKRAQEIPLFQMTAKNVGIRRARAPFICCTNIDLLFSDDLMRRLRDEVLDPQSYYRANRIDFPDGIEEQQSLDAQIAYAESHVIRVNGWDNRYKHIDAHRYGVREMPAFLRRIWDWLGARDRRKQLPEQAEFYRLDREACGDFTLMHRDAWAAIEGYLELDLYSIHVDTLGIAAARAAGYEQVVFPRSACTYHIDHPSGWSAMSALEKLKFSEERPCIDYSLMCDVVYHLFKTGERLHMNGPKWGMVDEVLEEVEF